MDKKSKEALRRYKKAKAREGSSSDSSSSTDSESGSSSSYSSSDSERKSSARRHRKKKAPRSVERRSKREKREHCQKKLEAKRDHLKRKLKEAKLKKRAAAAAAVLSGHSHRSSLSPSTQAKLKKLAERKHLREASKERRELEREKHRTAREVDRTEHHHSRSPSKIVKLRMHQDVIKQQQTKSPQHMHQLMSREKIIIQTRAHERESSLENERERNDRRHDERRECDRAEREAARNKERAEALERCQKRQRERERVAKLRREEDEKKKYGESGGSTVGSDRMLISCITDHDIMYSNSNRGYNSRERSLEALERTRFSTKRELDMYERNYVDVEHRGIIERTGELRHERENVSIRRREPTPVGSDRYATRVRDVRNLYAEDDRER